MLNLLVSLLVSYDDDYVLLVLTFAYLFTEDTLDHNTRFAKSLGFFEDAPWSLETPFPLSEDKEAENEDMEDTRRFSYLANENDSSSADLPPQPPAKS